MLQFNELRVSPDGKYLFIDVEVQNLDYYENVYIQSLYMNVYSKSNDFVDTMPDDKSILIWEEPEEDSTVKHIRKVIDIDTIGDNLFFIYAVAKGEPAEDTPCGGKESILTGITYNKSLLYKKAMSAINTIEDCTPSKELIDFILSTNAFTLSTEVGDYRSAINYWNETVKKQKMTIKNKCGCHGY